VPRLGYAEEIRCSCRLLESGGQPATDGAAALSDLEVCARLMDAAYPGCREPPAGSWRRRRPGNGRGGRRAPSLAAVPAEAMQACINGATTMPYPLEEDLAAAAAAGFRWVEIWAGKVGPFLDKHGVAGLRRALADHGLGAAAICPYSLRLFGNWKEGLERLRPAVALAAEIGCPLLLVCPDAPGPEEAGPDVWQRAGERARAYGELAATAGVRLAVEPLGGHPFLPGAREGLRLLRAADHPSLALMMDTFHYYKSGVTEADLRAVPPHLWAILHVNDVPPGDPRNLQDGDRLYPGEGVLPLSRTLRLFADVGFAGAVSVEVFRRAYWEQPAAQIARRAYEGLAAVLRAAGHADAPAASGS
jgi:2-keto-myo-inositol isomerase